MVSPIVHRAAGRGVLQRMSLAQPASAGPLDVAAESSRRSALIGLINPINPIGPLRPITLAANVVTEMALPLALPTGVVQRESKGMEALPGMAMAGHPPSEEPGSLATTNGVPAPAEKIDLDDVVERVMRRLTRSLIVEGERHGGRQWP